jgi:hypothetical protein
VDIIEILQLLAAGHNGLTAVDYVWNAIFGAIGAATAYLADKEGVVLLPRYDKEQHSVELGALGRVLVGAGAGTLVGYSGYIPFIAGVVAPTLLPVLVDKIAGTVGRGRK